MLSSLKEVSQTSLKDTTVELTLKNDNLTRTTGVEQCTGIWLDTLYHVTNYLSIKKPKILRLNTCTENLNYVTWTLSMFSLYRQKEDKHNLFHSIVLSFHFSTTRTLSEMSTSRLTSQNCQVISEEMHPRSTNWQLHLQWDYCTTGIPEEPTVQLFHVHLSRRYRTMLSFSIAKSLHLVLL